MSWWVAIPLAVVLVVGGAVMLFSAVGLIFWLGIKGMDAINARFGDGTVDKVGAWFAVAAVAFVAVVAVAGVARWLAS